MSCDVSVTATFKTTFVSFLVEMSVPGEGESGFTNGKVSDERRRGTREFPVLPSDLCCSVTLRFFVSIFKHCYVISKNLHLLIS